MSKELSAHTETPKDLIFEPENLTTATIKKFICPNANDQELILGLQICKSMNLNPLKREVYLIKYSQNTDEKMSIVTGYEVYLKRAERSGKYMGMKCWTEGAIKDGNLKGCIEVYRKGWDKPLYHEVEYAEYVGRKKDGSITKFWSGKPKTMIKKVAIAQGFRLAFPDELDGMPYTDAEIDEQDLTDDQPNNGKSRLENIVEEAEIVTPKPTPPPVKTPVKEKKSNVVEEAEEVLNNTSHAIVPVELKDGEKLAQGVILVPAKVATVEGPDGKPATKFNFTMGDANYGSFDKAIFDGLTEIIDRQAKQSTQVLLNIVYKDRIKKEKVFHDIVRFEVASVGNKVMPI